MLSYNLIKQNIHIWHATLESSFAQLDIFYQLLTEEEKARLDSFLVAKSREQYLVTRASIRLLLSHYLKQDPKNIIFIKDAYGKPRIKGDSALRFNLSHSGSALFFAISYQQEVGIDVEYCKPDIAYMDLAKRFFSFAEYRHLLSLPTERERMYAFYNAWVRKEAYIKAKGMGLMLSLKEIEMPMQQAPHLGQSLKYKASDADRWYLYSLPAPKDYAAALVVEGPVQGITFQEWKYE